MDNRYNILKIYRNVHIFQSVLEQQSAFLAGKLGDRNTSYIQTLIAVRLNQAKYICVVSDAEISAYFILFNIFGADDDDNFRLAAQLLKV